MPIETGTKPKASLADMQLGYRCAVLVRDLTAPLMLRRLKADFAQELELADKEEQVLFCQLTSDQIQLYCKFLSTETVRNARDKHRSFYAISVLRKICNHPDLLLADERDVDDFGHPSRSGKLAVLIPLLQLWQRQKKRCLVFSQSLGMLDILEQTLGSLDMSFSRIDGSTPIPVRAAIVETFDGSKSVQNGPFCLLLSTRVGGVGLNLTSAERVVIFDPDWNPMTDVQARERSWRIGQKNPVKIYRLIASDSLEEIICKRQIFKHHLAQKILVDPRQSKVADWDSMFDLFQVPASFRSQAGLSVSSESVKKLMTVVSAGQGGDREDSPEETELHSLITKVWNQDEIEMPKIASVLVDSEKTEEAASRAIKAVLAETTSTSGSITVPTWTGKSGGSATTVSSAKERSKSLVNRIGARTVFESEQLVVEKAVVRDLIAFFRKQKHFAASTEKVLGEFSSKISQGGQAEIFRSCLRELCEFREKDGCWVLRSQHR